MIWDHFKTILWLRWRLTVNQIRRHGTGWAIFVAIVFWIGLIAGISSFFVSLSLGMYLSSKLGPYEWMFVWDGIVLSFMLFWFAGLMFELQQSELLSLNKLLHLPISLTGTFVCNYLTSLISVSVAVFVPLMAGLAVSQIVTQGMAMLVLLPLIATFVLLISTVTYQFQGWLASMMTNPRRRREIIAGLSLFVILFSQLPNLVNILFQRHLRKTPKEAATETTFITEFNQRVARKEVAADQLNRELAAFRENQRRLRQESRDQRLQNLRSIGATTNAVLPIGWLAYGSKAATEGNVWPGIFGCGGALLISLFSLRRSYQTTLKRYTGRTSTRKPNAAVPAAQQNATARRPRNMTEWNMPLVSEHAAAIAWMNIRTLLRAPEVRLLVLGPLIGVGVIAGLIFAHGGSAIPAVFRPLLVLGLACGPVLGAAQLLQNQFGLDRSGFRALVLTAAPRRDILLGKNLSLVPLVLGINSAVLIVMQGMLPMSVAHFAGLFFQLLCTYLIFCLVGNMVSIWFPAAMASGSLKPVNANTKVVIAQVIFAFLFPVIFTPAVAIYGLDVLIASLPWFSWFPTFLVISGLEMAIVLWVYHRLVTWQGGCLQRREQMIAQAVAARSE